MAIQDIQLLSRLNNIFNPTPFNQASLPGRVNPMLQAPSFQQPEINMADRWSQLYQPDLRGQNMLYGALENFPQRDQYKPSTLRKIGAAIYGMSQEDPAKASDQFLNYHYYNALNDWMNRTKPIQEAAGLEREYNTNQRMMADQIIRREQEDRRLAEMERKNLSTEQLRQQEIDIRDRRAAVYEFKARNPNFVFKVSGNGYIVAIDPQNPTSVVPTGIKSNELSDMDKIQLGIQARLQTIEAQGKQTERNIALSGGEARITKATPSGGTAIDPNKPLLPTQERARDRNRAKQATTEHPEWSKYIQFSGTDFRVIPPSTRFGISTGPTSEMHKQIYEYIYGKSPTGATTNMNIPTGISRATAIKALQDSKIPVNEENIKKAMDPNNWK